MFEVKKYGSFNYRRYSNPWIAILDKRTLKPDFSERVGGYTGGYNRGEAGVLYLTNPIDGAVYMFGQKDYRGSNTERGYFVYYHGQIYPVDSECLIYVCSDEFDIMEYLDE